MRARGDLRLYLGAVLAACVAVLAPSTALADDANTVPPHLDLTPSGTEDDPVGGPGGGSLASYSTTEPDVSWGYTANSSVTFHCLLDGTPTPCSRSYYDSCCSTPVLKVRRACPRRKMRSEALAKRRRRPCTPWPTSPGEPYVPPGRTPGYGPFTGWVPIPGGLTHGEHKVTVIASDEDGTDPNPPTVTAVFDIVAPKAPVILSAPPRSSSDPTPRFKFAATDERKLYDTYNDPFSASLQRIKPTLGKPVYNGSPGADYLEWRGPFCPTPFRCTEVVWPVYSGYGEGGTTFGIPEHLAPGLYEFKVSVSDTVFNESPATRYRFRVTEPATP